MNKARASHAPYNKLKGFLRENNLTYSDLARLLGVSAPTISKKINGESDFSLREVRLIKVSHSLNDDIFL